MKSNNKNLTGKARKSMKNWKNSALCLLLLGTVSLAPVAFSQSGGSYNLTYSGQILDASGIPLQSAQTSLSRSIKVNFYHAVGDTTAVASLSGLTAVLDQTGVFSLSLPLTDSQMNTVFSSPSVQVWIEIVDVTGTTPVTYARQQYSAVPYAMKVPVDNTTITFNSSGQLSALPQPVSKAAVIQAINGDTNSTTIEAANLTLPSMTLAGDATGSIGSNQVTAIHIVGTGALVANTSGNWSAQILPTSAGGTGAANPTAALANLGVTSALALKADQTALTSGLALKADQTSVTNSLALKANVSDLSTLSDTVAGQTTSIAAKANKGANSDITSLSGLTTALTIAQGGTGATTQGAAQAALGLVPGNAAGNMVQLDANAKLPAVDGSQLTNLTVSLATSLGSGTTDVGGTLAAPKVQKVTRSTGTSVTNDAIVDNVNAVTAATSGNSANQLVKRDGSGNFSAGTISATTFSGSLSGNASSANSATNATYAAHYTGGVNTGGCYDSGWTCGWATCGNGYFLAGVAIGYANQCGGGASNVYIHCCALSFP